MKNPNPTGEQLRDQGIERAVTHADKEIPNWQETAFRFLRHYIKTHKEFLAEDVRETSTFEVPEPPSNRAWGAVMVRAVKEGLIEKNGYKKVSNPLAHKTPATLWKVVEKQDMFETMGNVFKPTI